MILQNVELFLQASKCEDNERNCAQREIALNPHQRKRQIPERKSLNL